MQLGLYLKVTLKIQETLSKTRDHHPAPFLETKSRVQSLKNKYTESSLDLVSKNCAGRSYNIGSTQDLVGQPVV